jgi:hypothetical protein
VSRPEDYDLLVLGSGRGRFIAWSMASEGKLVAAESDRILGFTAFAPEAGAFMTTV